MKKYTLFRDGSFYKGNLHTHTTVSDGDHSPEETAAIYRNAGYSFLAVTDHNRWGDFPELSDESFLMLPGVEIDTTVDGCVHHIVGIGRPGCDLTGGYRIPPAEHYGHQPQDLIDYLLAHRAMAIYAHPFWSYADERLLASLTGLSGMEIINYSCEQEWKSGISEVYFEYLWRDGNRIWCFGSDDAHGHVPDYRGGYITVKARALTREAILDAIDAGSFTASYGPDGADAPRLLDFYVEDGTAVVECTPCRNIYINVRREYPGYHPAHGTKDAPLTHHEWKLPEGAQRVRAILTGFDGSITWSQPILLA